MFNAKLCHIQLKDKEEEKWEDDAKPKWPPYLLENWDPRGGCLVNLEGREGEVVAP
jgi:hypothetical protein